MLRECYHSYLWEITHCVRVPAHLRPADLFWPQLERMWCVSANLQWHGEKRLYPFSFVATSPAALLIHLSLITRPSLSQLSLSHLKVLPSILFNLKSICEYRSTAEVQQQVPVLWKQQPVFRKYTLVQTMQVLPKVELFRGVVSMLFPPSLSFQLHSYNILTGETSSSKVSHPPICCWSWQLENYQTLKLEYFAY